MISPPTTDILPNHHQTTNKKMKFSIATFGNYCPLTARKRWCLAAIKQMGDANAQMTAHAARFGITLTANCLDLDEFRQQGLCVKVKQACPIKKYRYSKNYLKIVNERLVVLTR